MTKAEILTKYKRAIATQKRRTIIRLTISGFLIATAFLNVFGIAVFDNARVLFFSAVLLFLLYSYAMGRRTGAAKDFRAIAEHYISQDSAFSKAEKATFLHTTK